VKHSGSDGINVANDVINCDLIGNYITVGHPQHVYIGNGGNRAKYPTGIEGVCKNIKISNNMLYDTSTAPGFGGCAAITAYFGDALEIMGKSPPSSKIDTPVVVANAVWPVAQYNVCLNSGVQEKYRSINAGNDAF
jgi:hypothetical protein